MCYIYNTPVKAVLHVQATHPQTHPSTQLVQLMHKEPQFSADENALQLLTNDVYLSWLSYSYKLVKLLSVCLCVCLDVNQGGTNCNHCTHRQTMHVTHAI